jgi:hypothetical protein
MDYLRRTQEEEVKCCPYLVDMLQRSTVVVDVRCW